MAARQKQIMEEYVARLEYQLSKSLERTQIAEEKLAHIQRLALYGIEHPPSRYMYDASGSQPPMPQYTPSRSSENAKRPTPVQNNQTIYTHEQLDMQTQTQTQTQRQNNHMFFD